MKVLSRVEPGEFRPFTVACRVCWAHLLIESRADIVRGVRTHFGHLRVTNYPGDDVVCPDCGMRTPVDEQVKQNTRPKPEPAGRGEQSFGPL